MAGSSRAPSALASISLTPTPGKDISLRVDLTSGGQRGHMPQTEIEGLRQREARLETENTHLRTAAIAGQARERHHQAIVESALDFAIIAADQKGRITDWNAGAEHIFGWSASDMQGEPFDRIFTSEDRLADRISIEMRDAMIEGQVDDERWHMKKDGSRFWAGGEMMLLRGKDGAHEGFLRILRDRSPQRRAEDACSDLNETLELQVQERTRELRASEEHLRQAQKMEVVGHLTGGLAHDLNNMLNVVSGNLELLQAQLAQGEAGDLQRYLAAAQEASARAAALTHRLLAFARQQQIEPKPTHIRRLISGMEELIRRTMGPEVTVEVVAANGLWNILVDANQLENTLLNLCINARDAMPQGGRLTVEITNQWLDTLMLGQPELPSGEYLSLCVSDTGMGMTGDVIKHAFDPFFTTKPLGQGTGLGLSMIQSFAQQCGGQARIFSALGEGTTVCLYLPRNRGEAVDPQAPPKLADVGGIGEGKTVLVVDDEASLLELVIEVLEQLGYAAIPAANGRAAVKVLQSDAHIDLLISDVGLPGGMDGWQVADAAHQLRPDLKVLFITGYVEEEPFDRSRLGLSLAVLNKPFTMTQLTHSIASLLPPKIAF
jgi:PAS domain S-box-containing protein